MGKSAGDEKILSYKDVVLRRSDLDILSGPYFLNDRVIEFYFSYLSSCYPSPDILLVPPSIAFWIANCPDVDGLKDFVEPLDLPGKKLVIFPVNDNENVGLAEGGSHWSLLVFEREAGVFVHHDSSGGMNSQYAKRLYEVLVRFVNGSNSASDAKFIQCSSSPQQLNGYDCGLFVIASARVICRWYETAKLGNKNDLWFSSVEQQVTPLAVTELRTEILQLIKDLMAAGAK
ncbi:NEDD8-specific protease 1 [Rhodamnia argentea]|uniref:NEDD8-specific protease 1 n=1 Tax=Rhodamnia argentea TaxID=178133 RepID=A0ABM3HRL0_9MYRT|nr:NEDD8-specific protease 1 [Rhodamnia argentea]XP_048139225.1 NEDD8-specific protease 1 [Rhodamnia argentea]XP_048139226.1 NEDD8-specific protease 1 [Rhodamnia argentea]XP_048139227.1 NEDD8-specific protease 1 [Rhodamnia argentea]XP_048139228.1 NEDD8-specific protease 1 [Rhodamnia argentea]XP_048139229.1 NEDD8-specific protease 1 [Rhodamnia argentea]XP_048139230.1 NEDD8-specific protease 1 [Rhodamnia argentea]